MSKMAFLYADVVCGECGADAERIEWSESEPDKWVVFCEHGHVTNLCEEPILRYADEPIT